MPGTSCASPPTARSWCAGRPELALPRAPGLDAGRLTADGGLLTGDLGERAGRSLRVTGAKGLIALSTGRSRAAADRGRARAGPWIGRRCSTQGRRFVSALISLRPAMLERCATATRRPARTHPPPPDLLLVCRALVRVTRLIRTEQIAASWCSAATDRRRLLLTPRQLPPAAAFSPSSSRQWTPSPYVEGPTTAPRRSLAAPSDRRRYCRPSSPALRPPGPPGLATGRAGDGGPWRSAPPRGAGIGRLKWVSPRLRYPLPGSGGDAAPRERRARRSSRLPLRAADR